VEDGDIGDSDADQQAKGKGDVAPGPRADVHAVC
jgi:hypothetical protein